MSKSFPEVGSSVTIDEEISHVSAIPNADEK